MNRQDKKDLARVDEQINALALAEIEMIMLHDGSPYHEAVGDVFNAISDAQSALRIERKDIEMRETDRYISRVNPGFLALQAANMD
jgi:hypothetical protein